MGRPKHYAPRPATRWRPRTRRRDEDHGTRPKYWCDYDQEVIHYYDGFVVHEFPLSLLNSRVLTYLMVEGAIEVMRRSSDPQTAWLMLRTGTQQPRFRSPEIRHKSLLPLPIKQEAIVLALMDYSARVSRDWAESKVRSLTAQEIAIWCREPDVVLHYRKLRGDPVLRLAALATELLETGPPKPKRGRPPKHAAIDK